MIEQITNSEPQPDWRTVPRTPSVLDSVALEGEKDGKPYVWSFQLLQFSDGVRVTHYTVEVQHGVKGKPYSINNHRLLWKGLSQHWGVGRFEHVTSLRRTKLDSFTSHVALDEFLPTVYGGGWEHYLPKKRGVSKAVQKNVVSLMGFLGGEEPMAKRARQADNGLDTVLGALSRMYE